MLRAWQADLATRPGVRGKVLSASSVSQAHPDRRPSAGSRRARRDAVVFTSPEGGYLRFDNFRNRFWTPATVAAGLARSALMISATPAPRCCWTWAWL